MRPPGEIRAAILQAAEELHAHGRGPTLQELAERASVGRAAARFCVQNLTRSGQLEPVGQRRVAYRNRPVVEYAPRRRAVQPVATHDEFVDVADVCALWAQQG